MICNAWRLVASLTFATSMCVSAAASELRSIDMTVDENDQMTINLDVNERSGLGVIDTAATYALIDADMLTEKNSAARAERVEVLGLAGRKIFETALIGPVQTGDINLNTFPAAIVRQARFPGHKNVIPATAFDERVIDFDFNRNSVYLYDGRPQSVGDSVRSRLKYIERDGLPFIKVKLNGRTGLALIDTGSNATYVNSKFAEVAKARLDVDRTIRLFGADENSAKVRVMSAKRLEFGKHNMSDFLILSSDPPLFEHIGLADEPAMVLGLDVLRKFRLQIDRERGYIHISRAETRQEGRRFRVQPFSSRIRPWDVD